MKQHELQTMRFHNAPTNKGFTLVEISIVMVVIGLLIGGIFGGVQLIENARKQSNSRYEVNREFRLNIQSDLWKASW
jgi:prepilin-type N-terminal cleavage/methylation domain-containing protein